MEYGLSDSWVDVMGIKGLKQILLQQVPDVKAILFPTGQQMPVCFLVVVAGWAIGQVLGVNTVFILISREKVMSPFLEELFVIEVHVFDDVIVKWPINFVWSDVLKGVDTSEVIPVLEFGCHKMELGFIMVGN